MAENGKKRVEFIYTILGIILLSAAIIAGFWTIYAQPKVCEQSRLEIRDWWDQTGTFKVANVVDAVVEKKMEKIDKRIDMIYRMNIRRLPESERANYEVDTTR
jgi:hypothetical protein